MGASSLRTLKLRLGIQDSKQNRLLKDLLDEAEGFILGYTRRTHDKWLPHFDGVLITLAAAAYGQLGAEGLNSRTEGGIPTASAEGVPAGVTGAPDPYRLIKGLK